MFTMIPMIFALDTFIPRCYTGWLLYLFPLLLLSADIKELYLWIMIIIISILLPLGFLLEPESSFTHNTQLINRFDGFAVLWVVAAVIIIRNRTQKKIKVLAANDEAVLSSMSEGLIILNKNGSVIMNPAALKIHQFNSVSQMQRLLGENPDLFKFRDFKNNPVSQEFGPMARVKNGESFSDYELMVIRSDSGYQWFGSFNGTPVTTRKGAYVASLITFRNITELHKKTAEAAESKRILDALMQFFPAGILIVRADQTILNNSKYDQSFFGDWAGKHLKDRLKKTRLRPFQKDQVTDFEDLPLCRALNRKEIVFNEEWIKTNGEKDIIILVNAAPLLNSDNIVTGAVLMWIDITERKYHEQQIQKLNEQLIKHTDDLKASNEELQSFSYSVSHDLKVPLNIINGFTQLITEHLNGESHPEIIEYLLKIQASTKKMNTLIDDLLTLSKISITELKLEKINVSDLVSSILNELQNENPQRKVQFIVDKNLFATADLRLFHLAITNLLSNAWKYTNQQEITRIQFGQIFEKDKRILFVKDNGVGFDMEQADKLFKPFQRLHSDKEFKGTGVGLATVMKVVRKHQGEIWARSKKGEGATFYFILPDHN